MTARPLPAGRRQPERLLSLYVHWPFCMKKCSYCSFVSQTDFGLREPYLRALLSEIEEAGSFYEPAVDTVYLGGGTPSAGSGKHVERILDAVGRSFRVTEDVEVTIEANPCSVTKEKVRIWKGSGVNRVSLGMQAAQPRMLAALGRLHTHEQLLASYDTVREHGFSNVSLDLMFGLPWQTRDDWLETLTQCAALAPEHISAYGLTLEAGTPLYMNIRNGNVPEPDEDLQALMYTDAQAALSSYGYDQYEVSNFSLPGRSCRHNFGYWSDADYLGLGAAAHSKIDRFRFANTSSVEQYIADHADGRLHYATCTVLNEVDRLEEFLMLRTRLASGFTEGEYHRLFGQPFRKAHARGLSRCLDEKLVRVRRGRVQPTEKGFLFQNRLAVHLISDIPG